MVYSVYIYIYMGLAWGCDIIPLGTSEVQVVVSCISKEFWVEPESQALYGEPQFGSDFRVKSKGPQLTVQ